MADNVEKLPGQKAMPPIQAYAVSQALFQQIFELIRGNVCHRDADAVLQQMSSCQLAEIKPND